MKLASNALVSVNQFYEKGQDVHACGIFGLCRNAGEDLYKDMPEPELCSDFLHAISAHTEAASLDYSALENMDIVKVVRLAEQRCENIWAAAAQILSRRKFGYMNNRRDVLHYHVPPTKYRLTGDFRISQRSALKRCKKKVTKGRTSNVATLAVKLIAIATGKMVAVTTTMLCHFQKSNRRALMLTMTVSVKM